MNQGSYYSQPDLGDLEVYGQRGEEMPPEFCSTSCPNVELLFHTPMYQGIVGATAMATPFRRWTTCRARKEKTNSTLALAQASEPRVSLLFSPPGPSMV